MDDHEELNVAIAEAIHHTTVSINEAAAAITAFARAVGIARRQIVAAWDNIVTTLAEMAHHFYGTMINARADKAEAIAGMQTFITTYCNWRRRLRPFEDKDRKVHGFKIFTNTAYLLATKSKEEEHGEH